MKKNFFTIAILAVIFAAASCNNDSGNNTPQLTADQEQAANTDLAEHMDRDATVKALPETTVEVDQKIHDFGKVKEGEKVKHTFVLKNTGDQPFMISNVLSPCGCTVPSYSKKPIPPGALASVEIEFNTANKPGPNEKYLDVVSNAKQQIKLGFKAEVVK